MSQLVFRCQMLFIKSLKGRRGVCAVRGVGRHADYAWQQAEGPVGPPGPRGHSGSLSTGNTQQRTPQWATEHLSEAHIPEVNILIIIVNFDSMK